MAKKAPSWKSLLETSRQFFKKHGATFTKGVMNITPEFMSFANKLYTDPYNLMFRYTKREQATRKQQRKALERNLGIRQEQLYNKMEKIMRNAEATGQTGGYTGYAATAYSNLYQSFLATYEQAASVNQRDIIGQLRAYGDLMSKVNALDSATKGDAWWIKRMATGLAARLTKSYRYRTDFGHITADTWERFLDLSNKLNVPRLDDLQKAYTEYEELGFGSDAVVNLIIDIATNLRSMVNEPDYVSGYNSLSNSELEELNNILNTIGV